MVALKLNKNSKKNNSKSASTLKTSTKQYFQPYFPIIILINAQKTGPVKLQSCCIWNLCRELNLNFQLMLLNWRACGEFIIVMLSWINVSHLYKHWIRKTSLILHRWQINTVQMLQIIITIYRMCKHKNISFSLRFCKQFKKQINCLPTSYLPVKQTIFIKNGFSVCVNTFFKSLDVFWMFFPPSHKEFKTGCEFIEVKALKIELL